MINTYCLPQSYEATNIRSTSPGINRPTRLKPLLECSAIYPDPEERTAEREQLSNGRKLAIGALGVFAAVTFAHLTPKESIPTETVTMMSGMTLSTIAQDKCGPESDWRNFVQKIEHINGMNNPNSAVGDQLEVPVKC
jgi:LysM repeat protein